MHDKTGLSDICITRYFLCINMWIDKKYTVSILDYTDIT